MQAVKMYVYWSIRAITSSLFTGYGLVAHCEEPMYLHGNAFHANKSGGISIKQAAPVGIYDNSITCNAGTGILIIPSARVSWILLQTIF